MSTNTWNIDLTHSGIHFTVRHMVFAKVRGRFAQWQGTLTTSGDDLTGASVHVEIDAASIDTGVADRDAHLRSADFFDVENYPSLVFDSKSVERLGSDRLRITGELALHGVTREVVLEADYAGRATDPWGNQRLAFEATTSLNRKDFGLTWNQLLEAGGALVGDRVDITIELQAVLAAAAQAA